MASRRRLDDERSSLTEVGSVPSREKGARPAILDASGASARRLARTLAGTRFMPFPGVRANSPPRLGRRGLRRQCRKIRFGGVVFHLLGVRCR